MKHARATAPMAQDAVTVRMAPHPRERRTCDHGHSCRAENRRSPVTAAQIGQFAGTIGPVTAAALVLAGVLSVVLFPGTALTVLADHRREVPR